MTPGRAQLGAVGRLQRIPLPALAAASVVLVTGALALVFFVAPNDQFLGFSQRIFYFHVPIALTAYSHHTRNHGFGKCNFAAGWGFAP